LDGVEDGVINDPRTCTTEILNLDSLLCDASPAAKCLTAGQIHTAQAIYDGLKNRDGNVIAPGATAGAENAGDWAFWVLPNEQFGGASVVESAKDMLRYLMRHHPEFDVDTFDPANDIAPVTRELMPLDADDPDLSEFMAHRGKLIIYQGWNDFPLRPQRALDHLANVQNTMGGADLVDDFFRLFMVPGMAHCAGGPRAWLTDYVTPLVAWREQGEAPERIVGTQTGEEVSFDHLVPSSASKAAQAFTRPQCVYPKLAQYRGSGDTTDASNYVCR
jgi:feruloyl esterase